MSKREYLASLREYLSYELPERLVQKNIEFYGNYFSEQEKNGKSQQEICEELGDPQLIARSCIDAEKSGADGIPNSGDDCDFSEEMEEEKNGAYRKGAEEASEDGTGEAGSNRGLHVWKSGCLIPCLILLLLLALVIAFFSTPLGNALLLIILGVILVSGVIRLFRR